MARPTKYSKARAESICKALQIGATRTTAAESNGIEYETFRRWMNDNVEFYAAVTHAESQAELMFTATLYKSAKGTTEIPGDWRAAESWLKRRRRIDWGDNIDFRKLDDATLLRLLGLASGSEEARSLIE